MCANVCVRTGEECGASKSRSSVRERLGLNTESEKRAQTKVIDRRLTLRKVMILKGRNCRVVYQLLLNPIIHTWAFSVPAVKCQTMQ